MSIHEDHEVDEDAHTKIGQDAHANVGQQWPAIHESSPGSTPSVPEGGESSETEAEHSAAPVYQRVKHFLQQGKVAYGRGKAVVASATVQHLVKRSAAGSLILIKWLSALLASHALVIAGLVVAHHETSELREWSWTAAMEHYFASGEAAILSVTLTATALVSLVSRKDKASRLVLLFCLGLVVCLFIPAMVCPDVLLGRADVARATATSYILIMVGAGLAGAAECILGLARRGR